MIKSLRAEIPTVGSDSAARQSHANVADILKQRWPEAVRSLSDRSDLFFATGLPELDRLFSSGRGIPYGQLIEITGGPSSGKTSFLFRLLSANSTIGRTIVYVDFNHALFPDAVTASGIDLARLLVIKPGFPGINGGPPGRAGDLPGSSPHITLSLSKGDKSDGCIKAGIRTAELLLRDRHVNIVVFDLVGQRTPLPLGLLHRLRLKTVRAKGLVVFLTEAIPTRQATLPLKRHQDRPEQQPTSDIIPSSMAALRLDVRRCDDNLNHLRVAVTKSRLCAENIRLEVSL